MRSALERRHGQFESRRMRRLRNRRTRAHCRSLPLQHGALEGSVCPAPVQQHSSSTRVLLRFTPAIVQPGKERGPQPPDKADAQQDVRRTQASPFEKPLRPLTPQGFASGYQATSTYLLKDPARRHGSPNAGLEAYDRKFLIPVLEMEGTRTHEPGNMSGLVSSRYARDSIAQRPMSTVAIGFHHGLTYSQIAMDSTPSTHTAPTA